MVLRSMSRKLEKLEKLICFINIFHAFFYVVNTILHYFSLSLSLTRFTFCCVYASWIIIMFAVLRVRERERERVEKTGLRHCIVSTHIIILCAESSARCVLRKPHVNNRLRTIWIHEYGGGSSSTLSLMQHNALYRDFIKFNGSKRLQ